MFPVCSVPQNVSKIFTYNKQSLQVAALCGLAFVRADGGVVKNLPTAVWIYSDDIPLLPAGEIFNWKH